MGDESAHRDRRVVRQVTTDREGRAGFQRTGCWTREQRVFSLADTYTDVHNYFRPLHSAATDERAWRESSTGAFTSSGSCTSRAWATACRVIWHTLRRCPPRPVRDLRTRHDFGYLRDMLRDTVVDSFCEKNCSPRNVTCVRWSHRRFNWTSDNLGSVGVMGESRTCDNAVAVRCVATDDFMTADWSHLPDELLARISTPTINEVTGMNRVVYDISSKPLATIEGE